MLISLLLLSLGLLFSGYALFLLLRKRRLLRAGMNGLAGIPFLVVGGFFSMLLLNLQTYQQLTHETVLADVSLGQPTAQGIPLTLLINDRTETYLIQTNEWRLDARFVKWKPWMSLIGKEPVVRLERLEERGAHPDTQTRHRSYELVSDPLWIDDMVSALTQQLGLIDTVYGSSVYMPVAEHAEYRISASISGLVARPLNPPAERAVIQWSHPR
jgi:hypothetical protein